MSNFRDLSVYKKAFELSMKIFRESKSFPKEESLTDQIRRSSRSVCSNIAEGYRKRRYPTHFVSKCSDADMENSETSVWAEFAFNCEYISKQTFDDWNSQIDEIGKLLNHMMNNPEKYK